MDIIHNSTFRIFGGMVLSFRFKHMPSDNWLSSLFKRAGKSSKPKVPIEVTIPRGDMAAVDVPKRDFLARLFGPAFPRLTISAQDGTKYLFTLDPSGGFLKAMENAISQRE